LHGKPKEEKMEDTRNSSNKKGIVANVKVNPEFRSDKVTQSPQETSNGSSEL